MAETLVEPQVVEALPEGFELVPVEEPLDRALGWIPDLPDFRDYTPEHPEIKPLLEKLGVAEPEQVLGTLPPTVDLRPFFGPIPIEDQAATNSCTAHAAVGLIEYYEQRAFHKYLHASRRFVYKVTRDLLGWPGDVGAYLRTTMGAMVLFGVLPEKYFVWNPALINEEPSAFHYAFSQNFQTLRYFRYDPPGTAPATMLNTMKTYLAAGMPSMFGFTVYSSIAQAKTTGAIPFPRVGESVLGGHAIDIVGYDDSKLIKNIPYGPQTQGALLIRNSWGPAWGPLGGYLWLPYDYVLRGLANDCWSLLQNEWIDTGQFGI